MVCRQQFCHREHRGSARNRTRRHVYHCPSSFIPATWRCTGPDTAQKAIMGDLRISVPEIRPFYGSNPTPTVIQNLPRCNTPLVRPATERLSYLKPRRQCPSTTALLCTIGDTTREVKCRVHPTTTYSRFIRTIHQAHPYALVV